MSPLTEIQNLLTKRAELQARLNLIPYHGTIEVKEISGKKYLYIRKRELNKIKSTYIGLFSDDLYNLLLRNARDAKEIKKELRKVEKELVKLGYNDSNLSPQVQLNLEFARSNMKTIIYDQAILEGVGTTFPDTEAIIDNGKVNNVSADDVQKILNLKHAWEFILDKDIIQSPSDYYLSSYIAKLVNEGFYQDGGRIRGVPVTIGGSSYKPPLPFEDSVKDDIYKITHSELNDIDIAVELCLYVMKTQIYNDGNKRTAVIFANHYLITKAQGLLIIDYDKVSEFKSLLVKYYEDVDTKAIKEFLRGCIKAIR